VHYSSSDFGEIESAHHSGFEPTDGAGEDDNDDE
jgi:hypothetical protein